MTLSGKLCQFLTGLTGVLRSTLTLCFNRRGVLVTLLVLGLSMALQAQEDSNAETGVSSVEESAQDDELAASPLSKDIEDLKKAALELNRDLLILEEELLFPANTQIMVFLSLDVGQFFRLDAVKLHIDDKLVASHLYTPRQNDALSRGGIQRLYIGNIKTGAHEITAFFSGIGPDDREYKRGATITIEKADDPKMLEMRIYDSSANMQPEFDFKEWQL